MKRTIIFLILILISISLVTANPICSDTDGGDDIFNRGTLSVDYANGESYTYQDMCLGDSLVELNCNLGGNFSMNNGVVSGIFHECLGGCENGICLESPVPQVVSCGSTIENSIVLSEAILCGTGSSGYGLIVGADNIVIDCDNNQLFNANSAGFSTGIEIFNRNNVTIKNCRINNFRRGINVRNTENTIIANNSLIGNKIGIFSIYNENMNITNNFLNNNENAVRLLVTSGLFNLNAIIGGDNSIPSYFPSMALFANTVNALGDLAINSNYICSTSDYDIYLPTIIQQNISPSLENICTNSENFNCGSVCPN